MTDRPEQQQQQSRHQPYPKPSEGAQRPLKNDKPVWESWKSLNPRTRIAIASSVFVFSALGLYVSDKLEKKYPAVTSTEALKKQ